MNVLCLDQFSDLGGAQRCLLELLPAMIGRGWNVHVGAPGRGPLAQQAVAMGATFDPVSCGPYSSGKKTLADMARFASEAPRLAGEIRGLVWRYDAQLIYVNGPRLLPAVAMAARKGPPVVFHSHSLLSGSGLRVAGRALARLHAQVVASCNFVAEPLRPYCGDREIRVIYNGVREMEAHSRALAAGEFRIGVIGRISPEKGQAEFLRAARLLYHDAPQCRFVICGAPLFSDAATMRYCADLEKLAIELPVEFSGWTENVEAVLARLDLLVVPSAAIDATPRVILEGFAAGVPVVAFASGGIPEMIEHGVTGFLVGEHSPGALAATVRDLLANPDRLREVAGTARSKARTELSLDHYRAQVMGVIEAAVRN